MSEKKKKVRVELRKNRTKPPRENDLTRAFQDDTGQHRRRPVRRTGAREGRRFPIPHRRSGRRRPRRGYAVGGRGECVRGRVLRVHGLQSVVEADDGRVFRCAIRRLLKSLATDERSVVTTGDIVWLRPGSGQGTAGSGQ